MRRTGKDGPAPLWVLLWRARIALCCILNVCLLAGLVFTTVLRKDAGCDLAVANAKHGETELREALAGLQVPLEQHQALSPALQEVFRALPSPAAASPCAAPRGTSSSSSSSSPAAPAALPAASHPTASGRDEDVWGEEAGSKKPPASVAARSSQSAAPPATPGAAVLPSPVAASGPTQNWATHRALVIICYNRPQYLKRTLEQVIKYFPTVDAARPAVYISQDGNVASVSAMVREMKERFAIEVGAHVPFVHMQHEQKRLRGDDSFGYQALARHFGWALGQVFAHGHSHTIVLEDDLEIAPDFFSYFAATARVLDADPTLLAVSAYNDIGQGAFVNDPRRIYRSDFFPGLGWMLSAKGWAELGPKWPDGYWDDWLREPAQRKGRSFLRPEVSRTRTFGEDGVSHAQFFHQYLSNIRLNEEAVPWETLDLSYLLKPTYDAAFRAVVEDAKLLAPDELLRVQCDPSHAGAYKAHYHGFDGANSYPQVAKRFGFIADVKARVPRTAYQGVVSFKFHDCAVFLASDGAV